MIIGASIISFSGLFVINREKKLPVIIFLAIIAFLSFNIINKNFFKNLRFDLTKSDVYTLSDGTKKQAPVGLSHIIADDRDETPKFIQDVYFNEEKYPFLIKKFDSGDFDLKYNVKIFEINYKKFE